MTTVTIIEDDQLNALKIAEKVDQTKGLKIGSVFSVPGDFNAEFNNGYRSDAYILDCLWRADKTRNFGFEFARLILKQQPDALVVIMTQIEPYEVRFALKDLRIQAIVDKLASPSELEPTLKAIAAGITSDDVEQDVGKVLDSQVILEDVIDAMPELDLKEAKAIQAVLITWNLSKAATIANVSTNSFRKYLRTSIAKYGFSEGDDHLNSVWHLAKIKRLWNFSMLNQSNCLARNAEIIGGLSQRKQKVLEMYSDGHSVSEIVETIQIPQPQVSRDLVELRKQFEALHDVELWESWNYFLERTNTTA